MEASADQLLLNQNRKNAPFDKYKFVDKFMPSFNDALSYDFSPPLQLLNTNNEEIYSDWNMPCFKPEGIFSMKVYKPDSTIKHTMLIK